MKILIVSDSHGRKQNLELVLERVKPIDLFIHLGDFEEDEEYFETMLPCRVEMVAGNNDYFTGLPKDKMIQIGRYSVLLTHGHRYGVNFGTSRVKEAARQMGADMVLFGHTHCPLIDLKDNVWAINPGSISQPRQEGRKPTFIIMDLDSKGDAHFTLNYI